jgi:putative SOS response-associated peptidase YedK
VWLGEGRECREDVAHAGELIRPAPEDTLAVRTIGRAVNDIRNNGPELLDKATPLPVGPKQGELF